MRYLIWIGILGIGLGAGYLIGTQQTDRIGKNEPSTTEFITQTVVDTFIHTETIEIPVIKELADNLAQDSTEAEIASNDPESSAFASDTFKEDISISREKMVHQTWLNISVLEEIVEKDSIIKEMMGIKNSMPTQILVEFWESPLNFSGYKLSRSKLMLYGMQTHLDYKLFRRRGDYFLSTQTFYYSLMETEEFLPYLEVSKDVVFND